MKGCKHFTWMVVIVLFLGMLPITASAGGGPQTGSIAIRIAAFDEAGTSTGTYVNGVTVVLTDTSGTPISGIPAVTSMPDGTNGSGWAIFTNVPAGTYGVIAYKDGYLGYWSQNGQGCGGGPPVFRSKQFTAGSTTYTAAWDPTVNVVDQTTTTCHDLGLRYNKPVGAFAMRVQLFVSQPNGTYAPANPPTYLAGARVVLTDPAFQYITYYNRQLYEGDTDANGWVMFTGVPIGNYGLVAYRDGYHASQGNFIGVWAQNNCAPHYETPIVNNNLTEFKGDVQLAWENLTIKQDQTATCLDLGLAVKSTVPPPPPNPLPAPRPSGSPVAGATPAPLPPPRPNGTTTMGVPAPMPVRR